jgi:hypothetical protein
VPALVFAIFSVTAALDEGTAAWPLGEDPEEAEPAPDEPEGLLPQAAAAKATAISPPAANHRLRILTLLCVRVIGITLSHTDLRRQAVHPVGM